VLLPGCACCGPLVVCECVHPCSYSVSLTSPSGLSVQTPAYNCASATQTKVTKQVSYMLGSTTPSGAVVLASSSSSQANHDSYGRGVLIFHSASGYISLNTSSPSYRDAFSFYSETWFSLQCFTDGTGKTAHRLYAISSVTVEVFYYNATGADIGEVYFWQGIGLGNLNTSDECQAVPLQRCNGSTVLTTKPILPASISKSECVTVSETGASSQWAGPYGMAARDAISGTAYFTENASCGP
jgi:hypothetical protein